MIIKTRLTVSVGTRYGNVTTGTAERVWPHPFLQTHTARQESAADPPQRSPSEVPQPARYVQKPLRGELFSRHEKAL